MAISININNLTLCHKASGGRSQATLPDFCFTPNTPLPVSYPNIAFSSDLMKGTTTIQADGGNMCANFGSEFFKSTGDELGTLGGVLSGTFVKEATWITFSFDVKYEGKGACRLTDKMFHNHMNTVNMSGLLQKVIDLMKSNLKAGCEALLQLIKDLIFRTRGPEGGLKGLAHRFSEQINGKNGPGTAIWKTHEETILNQQKTLRKSLNRYDTWCGGGPPPPPNAWKWATVPPPTAKEWVGPATSTSTALRVAAGVGAVVMAGVTVVAVANIFAGPADEIAAGSATAALWRIAMGGGRVAVGF